MNEIDPWKPMDKLLIKMLNEIKCPLCNGQIDLISYKDYVPGRLKKYNFGCVHNPEHYSFFFNHWGSVIKIEYETVHIISELPTTKVVGF